MLPGVLAEVRTNTNLPMFLRSSTLSTLKYRLLKIELRTLRTVTSTDGIVWTEQRAICHPPCR
jgi:hypothetical protein